MGRPGRNTVRALLPRLIADHGLEFTIANGENAAGGMGITAQTAQELLGAGIDVITTGNHIWKQKEMVEAIKEQPRVLRPANYPPGAPGSGSGIFPVAGSRQVAVINICGTVFMDNLDCPFRAAEAELAKIARQTPVVLVDFHAEATSEKQAMGRFLDGLVSAVIGTHTHVQTADEQIQIGGTAYITDVGMTGPSDSILGLNPELVLDRLRSKMPVKFELASGPTVLSAVVVEIDEDTGKAQAITRLQENWEETD